MVKARVRYTLTGIFEVLYIIERVKVTDSSHTVFLKEDGMKVNNIFRSLGQGNDIYTPGKGLEICIRTGNLSESVHHMKCRLVTVKEKRLEPGATAGFHVHNPCFYGGLYCRHKILSKYTRTINRLKSIPE
jgi:hypothetical protein